VKQTALFLFAHQDDEVAVAPRIVHEVESGSAVHCAYLTDGASKGVPSAVRCAESARVMEKLGAGRIDVAFIGSELGTRDGRLAENLERTFATLLERISKWNTTPTRLYFLAWEGGHHDHDAVHAIGIALGRRFPDAVAWQFPLYNGYRTRGRFFRVMRALPAWGEPEIARLSLHDALRYAFLCTNYPSQARTWLGLFPGIFRTYVLQRQHRIYPVDPRAATSAPHEGSLLYERMFGVDRAYVFSRIGHLP
jgi:LmbE family N-acetylglucosaminyl deacetylase